MLLVASMMYTKHSGKPDKRYETEALQKVLLDCEEKDSEEDISGLSASVGLSDDFIHQRLSFFLELIAFCLNHANSKLYYDSNKANLLSIWENLVERVLLSLEISESKSAALRSIQQITIFPFSVCK